MAVFLSMQRLWFLLPVVQLSQRASTASAHTIDLAMFMITFLRVVSHTMVDSSYLLTASFVSIFENEHGRPFKEAGM